VNDKLERMWKEVLVDCFKVISRHSPGGTEKNHENPRSSWPVSGPTFEPGTSRIRSRSVKHSTTTFGNLVSHITGRTCEGA
jgi:hypothetical protein